MSEYIPRLREQLVSAAARERAAERHRPLVAPRTLVIAAAAAILAIVVVVAVRSIDIPNDERPATLAGESLRYRVEPAAAADRAADVLRARIAAAGIDDARVTVDGDEIAVDADPAARAQIAALAVPGRLAIYDWEASVLGPDGRPAPGNDAVTGAPDAGRGAALSREEAMRRAAKAPGGGRVVRAPQAGWFALANTPAVGSAHVANAMALREPATGDAIVAIGLDARGQAAFEALTREVAHRGADSLRPGEDPMLAIQHLAIVLDDDLEAVPFVDFQQAPDGIDGRGGVQIQGELTLERARDIAAILDAGPMPATLRRTV